MKIGKLDLSRELLLRETSKGEIIPMPQDLDRNLPMGSPSDYAKKPSRYGEAAAQAAQHVIDLENENRALLSELAQLKAHIQVIEETNQIIKADLAETRTINERLVRESSAIRSRIHIASKIILDLMEHDAKQPPLPPTEESKTDE